MKQSDAVAGASVHWLIEPGFESQVHHIAYCYFSSGNPMRFRSSGSPYTIIQSSARWPSGQIWWSIMKDHHALKSTHAWRIQKSIKLICVWAIKAAILTSRIRPKPPIGLFLFFLYFFYSIVLFIYFII